MEPYIKRTVSTGLDLAIFALMSWEDLYTRSLGLATAYALAYKRRGVHSQVRRFEEYMYGNSERFAEKAEVNA